MKLSPRASKRLKEGLLERQSADVVKTYRDSALALQQTELEKALKMLEKGADPEEVLARLARDLTNKLIHAPHCGPSSAREGRRQARCLQNGRYAGAHRLR